jgi:hypothetical protein
MRPNLDSRIRLAKCWGFIFPYAAHNDNFRKMKLGCVSCILSLAFLILNLDVWDNWRAIGSTVRCGTLALSALTLLRFTSILPVHRRTYEVFPRCASLANTVSNLNNLSDARLHLHPFDKTFPLGAYVRTENDEFLIFLCRWARVLCIYIMSCLTSYFWLLTVSAFFTSSSTIPLISLQTIPLISMRTATFCHMIFFAAPFTVPDISLRLPVRAPTSQCRGLHSSSLSSELLVTEGATESYSPLSNTNAGNVRKLGFLLGLDGVPPPACFMSLRIIYCSTLNVFVQRTVSFCVRHLIQAIQSK